MDEYLQATLEMMGFRFLPVRNCWMAETTPDRLTFLEATIPAQ